MINKFQNNCLVYKCKKDYRFFKKGKHYFAKKEHKGLIIVYYEKGRYLFFPEVLYSVFEEVALEWE